MPPPPPPRTHARTHTHTHTHTLTHTHTHSLTCSRGRNLVRSFIPSHEPTQTLIHSQEHESFEAESRRAYESEIASLSQQLDAHTRIIDDLMHHGHQRRANEAAAIKAAVLIARSAETGRTALSEEAEEDLAESDTELDTAASAAGLAPPRSDKRRGGDGGGSAAGGDAAAAEAERERLARQCDELATECSTLRLQVEDLEGRLDEEKAAWVEQVTRTARAEAKLATAVNARGGDGGGDDGGGGGGGGTALSEKEASAALAVAAQHQCLDPDNPTSVLAAVERLGAALAETEGELVELTEQLTEALQAASINTSMVSKGTAREAELQAELDACHETIEQLAAQLEAPS
jgi:hypothetical protein